MRFRRLKGGKRRQARTTTVGSDDAKERARIVACIRDGAESSKGDAAVSTLRSLEKQSGTTLKDLIDTPDDLVVAFRRLLGLGSIPILDSIRRELLLSCVGHHPRNGRVEALLLAFDKERRSVERGLLSAAIGG